MARCPAKHAHRAHLAQVRSKLHANPGLSGNLPYSAGHKTAPHTCHSGSSGSSSYAIPFSAQCRGWWDLGSASARRCRALALQRFVYKMQIIQSCASRERVGKPWTNPIRLIPTINNRQHHHLDKVRCREILATVAAVATFFSFPSHFDLQRLGTFHRSCIV